MCYWRLFLWITSHSSAHKQRQVLAIPHAAMFSLNLTHTHTHTHRHAHHTHTHTHSHTHTHTHSHTHTHTQLDTHTHTHMHACMLMSSTSRHLALTVCHFRFRFPLSTCWVFSVVAPSPCPSCNCCTSLVLSVVAVILISKPLTPPTATLLFPITSPNRNFPLYHFPCRSEQLHATCLTRQRWALACNLIEFPVLSPPRVCVCVRVCCKLSLHPTWPLTPHSPSPQKEFSRLSHRKSHAIPTKIRPNEKRLALLIKRKADGGEKCCRSNDPVGMWNGCHGSRLTK